MSLDGYGQRRIVRVGCDSELSGPNNFMTFSQWDGSFRILILGATSGLVETITDAVSIHSIKKAEYAKRLAQGKLGHVTLLDHFKSVSPTHIPLR